MTEQTTEQTEVDTDESTAPAQESTEPDVFPRAVVEDLRKENAKYRTRAQQSDALATRLHVELVRATGRLADPSDLPYDPEHLDDEAVLTAAIDDLLTRKPHLGDRRPRGDVGQGAIETGSGFNLLDVLRQRT